eukprot:7386889-Alexandrium_andersonii.AAC.1
MGAGGPFVGLITGHLVRCVEAVSAEPASHSQHGPPWFVMAGGRFSRSDPCQPDFPRLPSAWFGH